MLNLAVYKVTTGPSKVNCSIHTANFVTHFNKRQHTNQQPSQTTRLTPFFPRCTNRPTNAMSLCTPLILKLSNGCSGSSASRHSRLPPRQSPRHPMNRGIGQSQGRRGRDGEQNYLLLLQGIEPRLSTRTDHRLVTKPAHSNAGKAAATNQPTVP